jgi:hypothetical protein
MVDIQAIVSQLQDVNDRLAADRLAAAGKFHGSILPQSPTRKREWLSGGRQRAQQLSCDQDLEVAGDVKTAPSLPTPITPGFNVWTYAPHPDGRRLLAQVDVNAPVESIGIVTSWQRALAQAP